MASFLQIKDLSEWNLTTSNRILFNSPGIGKLFYFNHAFNGLGIDNIYWGVVESSGNPYIVNNGLKLSLTSTDQITSLRSSSFWSGDFDAFLDYSNITNSLDTGEQLIFFEMSNEDLGGSTFLKLRIGVGRNNTNHFIRTEVIDDTGTLFTQNDLRPLTNGRIRIVRLGNTVSFFQDNGSGWELLSNFTDAKVGSESDLFVNLFTQRVSATEIFGINLNSITFSPVGLYSGDIMFDTQLSNTSTYLFYDISASQNTSENFINIRIKSAENQLDLDAASWSSFNENLSDSFPIAITDQYFRIHLTLSTTNHNDSPNINSIVLGVEEILDGDDDIVVISPSTNETFDNLLRIVWQVPDLSTSLIGKVFYSIEYKNDFLGITNFTLIDSRVNPLVGFYDWDVSDLVEDGNYEIRITSVFDDSISLSGDLPEKLLVVGAGDAACNGIYQLSGLHNGENLYTNESSKVLYFNGIDTWYINEILDNDNGYYFTDDVLGDWELGLGLPSAPIVTELFEDESESSLSVNILSSSSFDFSSTSSNLSSNSSSFSSSSQSSDSSDSSSSLSSSSDSSSIELLSSSSLSSSSSIIINQSSSISSASSSTNVLTSSSSSTENTILKGVGQNEFNQLSIPDFSNKNVYVSVLAANEEDNFKIISLGGYHSFIVKQNGTVWASGKNEQGQLGLGDNLDRAVFTQISTDFDNALRISCGLEFTVIQKRDGTVWVTGDNRYGQLGLGDNINRNSFVKLPVRFNNARKISAGGEFVFIEKTNGFVECVGYNEYGQLGLGDVNDRNSYQEIDHQFFNIKKLKTGSLFTYLENSNGKVWATGDNFHGQLGLGHTEPQCNFIVVGVPAELDSEGEIENIDSLSITNPKDIQVGGSHVIIIKEDDTVVGTGDNTLGQLGLGDDIDRLQFTLLDIDSPVKVRVGFHYSIYEDSIGNLFSTGYNHYGTLGLGDFDNRYNFEKILGIFSPVKISSGPLAYHNFIQTAIFSLSTSSAEDSESSSSTERLFIDDYKITYMEFFQINPVDPFGDFNGRQFIIPINDVRATFLSNVSVNSIGDWTLEKWDGLSFVFHSVLEPGEEIEIEELVLGDRVRVVFSGTLGAELFSYQISLRDELDFSS